MRIWMGTSPSSLSEGIIRPASVDGKVHGTSAVLECVLLYIEATNHGSALGTADAAPYRRGNGCIPGRPGRASSDTPESRGFAGRCKAPPSRRLAIVVRLRRVSSLSVAAGQPLSPEVPGERTREDGLDSRLRLTWLAAIRDGGGLARKTTSPNARSQRRRAGLSSTIAHPGPPPPDRAAWEPRHPINAVELSSCQGQTDRQCSSKVQQPGRLTSDLHRPDMTF